MLRFVCVHHCCYKFLSVSPLNWPKAWLQHDLQCLLPFIRASAFITKFLLAFPPTILRLEGFQWPFISPLCCDNTFTPHTLSLPHFIKVLWGAPVTGPLGHRILFHYLSTQGNQSQSSNLSPSPSSSGQPGCYNHFTTTSSTHILQTNNRFWLLFPHLAIVTFGFLFSSEHWFWVPLVQSFWQGRKPCESERPNSCCGLTFSFWMPYILSPLEYGQFNEMSKYWQVTM